MGEAARMQSHQIQRCNQRCTHAYLEKWHIRRLNCIHMYMCVCSSLADIKWHLVAAQRDVYGSHSRGSLSICAGKSTSFCCGQLPDKCCCYFLAASLVFIVLELYSFFFRFFSWVFFSCILVVYSLLLPASRWCGMPCCKRMLLPQARQRLRIRLNFMYIVLCAYICGMRHELWCE